MVVLSSRAGSRRWVDALVGQVEQRVPDQLAGAVVGHVAAAVAVHELGADRGGVDEHVLGLGPPAEGEHVRVLEQQQVVVGAVGEQAVLEGVGVPVGNAAQPADPERHSSAVQSRVSMISRSRSRNAAT